MRYYVNYTNKKNIPKLNLPVYSPNRDREGMDAMMESSKKPEIPVYSPRPNETGTTEQKDVIFNQIKLPILENINNNKILETPVYSPRPQESTNTQKLENKILEPITLLPVETITNINTPKIPTTKDTPVFSPRPQEPTNQTELTNKIFDPIKLPTVETINSSEQKENLPDITVTETPENSIRNYNPKNDNEAWKLMMGTK